MGKNVNQSTSRKHGRRGLNYWEITVLAAARLGCNLDHDKLQDLAENHRTLRQIMGIGDWQGDVVDFDCGGLKTTCSNFGPTLKKINDLIVGAGHELKPKAIESVRGEWHVDKVISVTMAKVDNYLFFPVSTKNAYLRAIRVSHRRSYAAPTCEQHLSAR